MKKILEFKLKLLAKMILWRYRPQVIGITGSVGKTSTKEAVQAVLSAKFKVRSNIKNYNNEIGLPLTIIGEKSPGKNFFVWAVVFAKALKLAMIKDNEYPQILVLEMGVDKPKDMDYLLKIVKPNMGIVTMIGTVHLENFGNISKLKAEKGKLIKATDNQGWSILNYDNEDARKMTDLSKAKVLTYGMDPKADVRAQEMVFSFEKNNGQTNIAGISFKLTSKGSTVPVFLPDVLGYNSVYAALAGAAAGIAMKINLVDISRALKSFKSPRGRMNLIDGIKRTHIIDDTYNAEPKSVMSAIDVARRIPVREGARKFAVLGDMLELGSESEDMHAMVGEYVKKANFDILITCGERAKDMAKAAKKAGMNENAVFEFADSKEAKIFVQERIKEGDLILVKGSQGMRMERVVEEIMAEPQRASELLVRQEKEWKKE